ncbi:hypothetical protein K7W42_22190 [Deinococcus sp. HMF7604]|uniref:hypothetical protein n=1 Tax=Deinococcus betulae TaxID=2873312 RepID=UPI001CC9CF7D|nr:hypothetical protein [Deinococcus betulae]MBZ9753546.1 hypothetical protein [Deinococcus betulae]
MNSTYTVELPVLVAIIGFTGVIIAALLNILNKYLELSIIRKKEILNEKLKEISNIRSLLADAFKNSSQLGISLRMAKIDEYINENIERVKKMPVLMSQEDLSAANVIMKEFFEGLNKFAETKSPMRMENTVKGLDIMLAATPWIISHNRITAELIKILATVDSNEVKISRTIKYKIDEIKRNVYSIPYELSEQDKHQRIVEHISSIFNIQDQFDLEPVEFSKIQGILNQEVSRPRWYLAFLEQRHLKLIKRQNNARE